MKLDQLEVIATDTPIDIEYSAGGINAYCFECPATERVVGYPICLNVIQAKKEDRLGEKSFADCQSAIASDNCLAIHMSESEQRAGHTLYFWEQEFSDKPSKPRVPQGEVERVDKTSLSYIRGLTGESPETKVKPKPRKKPKRNLPEQIDHADQVNKEMAKIKTKKPTQKIKPNPGESVPDFLKRKRALMAR